MCSKDKFLTRLNFSSKITVEWYFKWKSASSVHPIIIVSAGLHLHRRFRWYFFPTSQSMHIIVHVRHQSHKITRKAYVVKMYFLIPIDSTFRPQSHPQRQITARCKCHVNLLVNTPRSNGPQSDVSFIFNTPPNRMPTTDYSKPQQFYDRIRASIKLIPCCWWCSTKNISRSILILIIVREETLKICAPKPWNLADGFRFELAIIGAPEITRIKMSSGTSLG